MALNNFETKTQSFIEIMGNGKRYTVPKFQRDYSWEDENWEDLWQDITELQDSEDEHYMGHLLLQTDNKKDYIVIDGQQRLTTVTIIILACLHELKHFIESGNEPEENKKRLEDLSRTYIGITELMNFIIKPKLTLNYNNEKHFRLYLCNLQKASTRKTNASEKLLSKAQEFYIEQIKERKFINGGQIVEFIENLVYKLQFTTITVASDLNAYKVFETLNARGVKLSTPDLLKNYLFSIMDAGDSLHPDQIRQLEETWGEIISELGKNDFSRFVHVEWNSRNSLIQKGHLFKALKKNIKTKELAFPYLQNLLKSSEVYAALNEPKDSLWDREIYKQVKLSLRTLDLFNITQPHGLLIAAYFNFNAKYFVEIAHCIEVVSIRYNAIGRLQPNVQERIYNKLACEISNKNITNVAEIKNYLKEVYPNDVDFYNDFIHKHMRTAQSIKKVRFLLSRIEESLNAKSPIDDEILTLEHVLPQNPDISWEKTFANDDIDECVERLGNMTLLQKDININMGNKSFEEKIELYRNSTFIMTQKLSEYNEWNKEAVEHRQKWLADQAVKCWRIDFE